MSRACGVVTAALVMALGPAALAQEPGEEAPRAEDGDGSTDAAPAWCLWTGLFVGPVWGGGRSSFEPAGAFGVDAAISYHFVYVGLGLVGTWFSGVGSFSQNTTGGVRSSGAPISFGGDLEAGLAQNFFIYNRSPVASVALRPGVGYGYKLMSDATQSISSCVGCDSRSYHYDAGHYVRFQLGIYYFESTSGPAAQGVFTAGRGTFVGGTVSLQHYILASERQLQNALLFGFAAGFHL